MHLRDRKKKERRWKVELLSGLTLPLPAVRVCGWERGRG